MELEGYQKAHFSSKAVTLSEKIHKCTENLLQKKTQTNKPNNHNPPPQKKKTNNQTTPPPPPALSFEHQQEKSPNSAKILSAATAPPIVSIHKLPPVSLSLLLHQFQATEKFLGPQIRLKPL